MRERGAGWGGGARGKGKEYRGSRDRRRTGKRGKDREARMGEQKWGVTYNVPVLCSLRVTCTADYNS